MLAGLPNYLTLFRIILIPVVAALFYLNSNLGYWIASFFFVIACITDFLDGYYARTLRQTTQLGRFLDPMADKLLIASTLLLLVGFDHIKGISLIPAIIILCRELLVSGLREFLAETKISMPVTQLAKWKTALQMTSLTILIAATPLTDFLYLRILGTFGLWASAILTLITGYDYCRFGLKYISNDHRTNFSR
ncbi:MAG: CDP-diacylglycerol--glycerol-3-phosphate 3-phosphatidyltransferase [Candidatus Paracaedimonas acanthamoebae]|uniref:CDP-diacylglycerol--glycerol-3-phosphate 3-phosphatidyltransferase n=1 Tax=Candidatus Paracaedimonas acanthamoebae TaxID=244581 RepID=A0A8J7PVV6_9PROT|nr:CDP-diacylglycerol--glycerol-3-phosphate 3-phosphatidyltransferase [Candidatus Paracaedimonas acanthamoebae]